jgi:hypothetical protein
MKKYKNGYRWIDPQYKPNYGYMCETSEKELETINQVSLAQVMELWGTDDQWLVYSIQDSLLKLVREGVVLRLEQLKILLFHHSEYRRNY